MTSDPTVFIVDDDMAVRDSMDELIHPMGLRTKGYDTAKEFLDEYDDSCACCLLIEVRLQGMSGMKLFEYLIKNKMDIPVIFTTGYGDIPTCVKAMRMGALDFLEKPCPTNILRMQIEKGIEINKNAREAKIRNADVLAKLELLTPDEREVMEKLVAGLTSKNIAAEMEVSLRTVQFRRSAIMKKMDVNNRASLMAKVMSLK